MRWSITGVAVGACVVAAGLLYGWTEMTRASDAAADWRARDLRFLKSANDRIQADLQRHPGGTGEASLLREQKALLQAMAAVAHRMLAETVPIDVRSMLPSNMPSPQPPSRTAAAATDQAAEPATELRVGLTGSSVPTPDLAEITFDAALRAPLPRKSAGAKPRSEKSRAEKPTEANAAETPGKPPKPPAATMKAAAVTAN